VKIFIAATSLRSEYGGPAYSVARLAGTLSESGHELALWAADGSTHSGPASLLHFTGNLERALRQFGSPDVIHDNGLWRPHNHALSRYAAGKGIARLVSTRGMLEPWAFEHKRSRKRIAWLLYQRRDLERAGGLHATSAAEGANLERMDLGVPITVIPNAVDLPTPSSQDARGSSVRSPNQIRTALFLGRLYPVKGLPMLVRAWADVRPRGWQLKIAGPDEGGHRRQLETSIEAARLEDAVTFAGPVTGDARTSLFNNADLFVLPTHSESYGMAVAEALAHSLPVLTTLSAPWPMLEERKCGWLARPDHEGIASALREATAMDPMELSEMGRRGYALIAEMPSWQQVADRFAELYSALSSGV